MSKRGRLILLISMMLVILLIGIGSVLTTRSLKPLPASLSALTAADQQPRLLDRYGLELNVSYAHRWNIHKQAPLHAIPALIQQAFIQAEDRRFEAHSGVDWQARLHAVWQNIWAGRAVRGASTISEQVVRMLHPRPRTIWSRWLEGFEATRLEQQFSKAEVLEFYLNQVPYARQWRGVKQAAEGYFGRSLETLSTREMLALAVLVRAPGRMDLFNYPERIADPLRRLAMHMQTQALINQEMLDHIVPPMNQPQWDLKKLELPVQASHFIRQVRHQLSASNLNHRQYLPTTLDGTLQHQLQSILQHRLHALEGRNVHHAAALVVDHQRGEILAWVNAGGSNIDAVITPRQPGSTLKPLLYALAMEKGWSAATIIADNPLAHGVGAGLHNYHNYSRKHYGPLRLRDALGNSLNIPAIRAIQYTGVESFLARLHQLDFDSLKEHTEFYGEGLALGNGEVTLLELVQAYATLANRGQWKPLSFSPEIIAQSSPKQIINSDVSSIISNILSDPEARSLEFGRGSLLRYPVQTAIKTGTSSDYRDAWTVAYSHRYTVGIWMGNLNREPMHEVTGSLGPALVMRSIFAELSRHGSSTPLFLSPLLQATSICRITGKKATAQCPSMHEWFRPESIPNQTCALHTINHRDNKTDTATNKVSLIMPTPGLRMAEDPRIPDHLEAFPMQITMTLPIEKVEWYVDQKLAATTKLGQNTYQWPLKKGPHTVFAKVWAEGETEARETQHINYSVR